METENLAAVGKALSAVASLTSLSGSTDSPSGRLNEQYRDSEHGHGQILAERFANLAGGFVLLFVFLVTCWYGQAHGEGRIEIKPGGANDSPSKVK